MTLARGKDLGMIKGVAGTFGREITCDLFRRICFIRRFEQNVQSAFDAKLIKMPIYLSLGQEAISAALSIAFPNRPSGNEKSCEAIFAQHRCHDIYLAYGGDPQALRDELLHRPSGCAKGMGGSASIHSPAIGMFGHDGLMGTQIPIAVGYALATKKNTLAVMGDASAEEDYVLGAMGYAASKKAPVLFVCYDNGLSILTKVEVRRSWTMASVAASFGMPAIDITDDPWLVMHWVKQLKYTLPAFINVHTVRHLWHSGTGTDGPPEWNRFLLVQGELKNLGFKREKIRAIEDLANYLADKIWLAEFAEAKR